MFIFEHLLAQDSQKGAYVFRVKTFDKKTTKGYLTAINDYEMVLKRYRNTSFLKVENEEYTIPVKNIRTIKFRKKGKIWKSALVGSGIGFLTGGLIALVAGDDPEDNFLAFTKEQKIALFGPPLAGMGFGIGALIGRRPFVIKLNKNQTKFKDEKKRLENYVLKN